jgi:Domain of unknown function (DUF4440)
METPRNLLVAAALAAVLLCPTAGRIRAADDPAVQKADQDFAAAAEKSDVATLGKLLDADFLWIDANGKTANRAQVTASAPKPAPDGVSGADIRRHDYGQVEVIQADSGKMHVLRVWVKRPAGWRALVYQEVRSADVLPKVTPSANQQCQNPCKSVPMTAKNETQRAIIEAYRGLETSAMTHDAANWDAHTGEEFIAASSNSDRLLDKPTRLGELKRANMAGLAPTPLASGTLFEFGDAAVMRSRHVPETGKPLEVTRVWVKRDGRWVEVLSYQTSVQQPAGGFATGAN